jgi:hypothetical protein
VTAAAKPSYPKILPCSRRFLSKDLPTSRCGSFSEYAPPQTPYNGPTPPQGTHRYIITLYKQSMDMDTALAPSERYAPSTLCRVGCALHGESLGPTARRCKFNPEEWADAHGLDRIGEAMFRVAA